MNNQPKMEPGSSSTTHIILDREEDETHLSETDHNLEDKTISDLVEVLRIAYLPKTFDNVEAVLLSKDMALREHIQLLQQNDEIVKQQLEEEKLARLKAEEELKKRERVSEEGKKLEQRYSSLLKELKKPGLVDDEKTIDNLRKRNIELKEMWGKEKREVQKYEGLLKEAERARLADRDVLEEVKKKNIEFECEVKKLDEKRVEDEKELQVLKSKNGELESRVLELKEKRMEDENALDVLRKMKDELEHQVLELKGKKVEDEKLLDVLTWKNGKLESQVLEELKKKKFELECEVKKLKEKRIVDGNSFDKLLDGIREKNGELKNEVLELQSKVQVLEDDRKALKKENISLAEGKHKGEILLESLNMKFKELHERVAKVEDDTELLMSVDVSGGGKNEGDPPADPMVAEFGNDTVQAAVLPRNEDAQLQNIGSKDAQGSSSASGGMEMVKDTHEKKANSGIAMKNDHPTPSSSIAVDMTKRKHSIADAETSSSGSSCDLSYLNNLASRFVVPEAKKKKM